MKSTLCVSLVALTAAGWVGGWQDGRQGDSKLRQEDRELRQEDREVTFTEHVAPIVFNHCTSCHRPGEIAPFSLMTYREVSKRARMIARVTRTRFMPPWHPAEGHGEFLGEKKLRLGDEQIETIQKWVKAGRPEGDPAKLPKMPDFNDGWRLGKPDMILRMPEGFEVPAAGPDIYRNFVVPVDLEEDKWVTAIAVRPSARNVLHHVIFAIDPTREARRLDGRDGKPGYFGMSRVGRGRGLGRGTSALGGWAVGGQARPLPMGLARKLPKGSDLILRSHLHLSGKKEVEQTTIGLYLTDKPPTRTAVGIQLPAMFGIAAGLDIPPGKKDFSLKDSFTLPVDVQAVTVGGHAHYICTQMHIWATPPGGEKKSIFWIDDWDFDWQNRYTFKAPLDLPAGTMIEAEVTYDNSADNPNQQFNPPRRITWGPQSTDEMGSVTLLVVAKEEEDTAELRRVYRRHVQRSFGNREAMRGFRASIVNQIRMLDRDGDGKIKTSEIPQRWRRWIERLDRNDDGVIDEKELEAIESWGRRRRR